MRSLVTSLKSLAKPALKLLTALRSRLATTSRSEDGVIAIFMAIILSLLLLVSTMSSARLQLSEISQSSQVDRSQQAYYAAEAGIEEALLRLKNNPNGAIDQVFPEQVGTCSSGVLRGSQSPLLDISGNWIKIPSINPDCGAAEIGQLAWRNRQVYLSSSLLSGTQVKDESIQYDTSSLRRNTPSGTVGADGRDIDGSDIFGHFQGLQYCWNINQGNPSIEVTALSWPKDQLAVIATEKIMVPSNNAFFQSGSTGSIQTGAYDSQYAYCLRFNVASTDRRYVFRLKPVFAPDPVGNPGSTSQNQYSVSYQAALLDSTLSPYPLYIPNDAVIIDVIGQSGDIRRRLVAKKRLNGQILSVFDYVLYSGDPATPICKGGVSQSDVTYSGCLVVPADNSLPPGPPPTAGGGSTTTNYSGSTQSFVVPAGITAINVDVQGAAGGTTSGFPGGKGARVQARLSVTPGETLTLIVGGAGTDGGQLRYGPGVNLNMTNSFRKPGGYNGGGNGGVGYESGYSDTVYELGGSGGGSSEIRRGSSRLVVAGGGGGAGAFYGVGGSGGDPNGQVGGSTYWTGSQGGGGGSQGGGGSGGGGGSPPGQSGGFGQGGQGGDYPTSGNNPGGGGGGGGGYYGGGGGGAAAAYAEGAGGGGGSSFAGAGSSSIVYTTAYRSGSGTIIISF